MTTGHRDLGARPPAAATRFDIAWLVVLPRPLLLAVIVALASLVVFAELPDRPIILRVLQKLGHPGVFALVAVSVLVLLLQRHRPHDRPSREYLVAFFAAVALGGVTEIAQLFVHRDAALHDVWLDARGALCALLFAAAFDQRLRSGHRPQLARAVYLGLCAALAVVICWPFGWAVASYANRWHHFPVLFEPASALDLYFIDAAAHRPELVPSGKLRSGHHALRVPLLERPYAGVSFIEPSPDWRGYRTLVIDVSNPGTTALDFNVRIDDWRQDHPYADRYNAKYLIPPGTRRVIETPLAEIESGPRGPRMDMAHIAIMMLGRAGAGGPESFLLNGMALR